MLIVQAAYRPGKCSCLLERLLESRDCKHLLTDNSLAVTDDDVRCLFIDILIGGKILWPCVKCRYNIILDCAVRARLLIRTIVNN